MVTIKQLLSLEEVQEFADALRHVAWLDGKTSAMGMAAGVKSNSQADSKDVRVKQLMNRLLARMGHHPLLVSAALPHRIFPPVFNRYTTGESYGFHVDGAIMRLPDSAEVMRSDLSMTLFLTNPDDYEGGELVIATGFGEQRVKGCAGDAVLYPSSSLHQVTPVVRGERLAVITWIQSLVADASMRQILFELDSSIQAIGKEEKASRDELDRLHNVYHNLIRRYAGI